MFSQLSIWGLRSSILLIFEHAYIVSKRRKTTILSRVIFRRNGIISVNPVTFNSLYNSIVFMYFICLFLERSVGFWRWEICGCPLQVSFGHLVLVWSHWDIFIHAVDPRALHRNQNSGMPLRSSARLQTACQCKRLSSGGVSLRRRNSSACHTGKEEKIIEQKGSWICEREHMAQACGREQGEMLSWY